MPFLTVFILILSLLTACEKPQAEPERMDPIYEDLQKEAAKADAALKQSYKDLEGFEKELSLVVPQTGQIGYARKRVAETSAKIEFLKQTKFYWEMKVESRKKWARKKYLAAYKEKKPWPNPDEWEEYKIQRKLEVAPRNWNIKKRIEESQLGINLSDSARAPANEKGEAGAPAEAPKH